MTDTWIHEDYAGLPNDEAVERSMDMWNNTFAFDHNETTHTLDNLRSLCDEMERDATGEIMLDFSPYVVSTVERAIDVLTTYGLDEIDVVRWSTFYGVVVWRWKHELFHS